MKGYIALMLGIVIIFWTMLAILSQRSRLSIYEVELNRAKVELIKEKQRFENCKNQLGVFYRDPCKDNPEIETCK